MTARPTDRDLLIWGHLARAARRVARNPETLKTGRLDGNARARNLVFPVGHDHRNSAFDALRTLGQRWRELSTDERLAAAPELERLARECAEILETPPASRRTHPDD